MIYVADTAFLEADLQLLCSSFAAACLEFGLQISLKKTHSCPTCNPKPYSSLYINNTSICGTWVPQYQTTI